MPSATNCPGLLLGNREAHSVPPPTFPSLFLAKIRQNYFPIQPGLSAKLESRNTHGTPIPKSWPLTCREAHADEETQA